MRYEIGLETVEVAEVGLDDRVAGGQFEHQRCMLSGCAAQLAVTEQIRLALADLLRSEFVRRSIELAGEILDRHANYDTPGSAVIESD